MFRPRFTSPLYHQYSFHTASTQMPTYSYKPQFNGWDTAEDMPSYPTPQKTISKEQAYQLCNNAFMNSLNEPRNHKNNKNEKENILQQDMLVQKSKTKISIVNDSEANKLHKSQSQETCEQNQYQEYIHMTRKKTMKMESEIKQKIEEPGFKNYYYDNLFESKKYREYTADEMDDILKGL